MLLLLLLPCNEIDYFSFGLHKNKIRDRVKIIIMNQWVNENPSTTQKRRMIGRFASVAEQQTQQKIKWKKKRNDVFEEVRTNDISIFMRLLRYSSSSIQSLNRRNTKSFFGWIQKKFFFFHCMNNMNPVYCFHNEWIMIEWFGLAGKQFACLTDDFNS